MPLLPDPLIQARPPTAYLLFAKEGATQYWIDLAALHSQALMNIITATARGIVLAGKALVESVSGKAGKNQQILPKIVQRVRALRTSFIRIIKMLHK